jgi:hypothetical protein
MHYIVDDDGMCYQVDISQGLRGDTIVLAQGTDSVEVTPHQMAQIARAVRELPATEGNGEIDV